MSEQERHPLPSDVLSLDDAYPGMALADQVRAYAAEEVAAERERWQRDQQVLEDTRTQRDELLAHIAGTAPLPQWAADWLKTCISEAAPHAPMEMP